jgi:predicted DNA-binding transcriptional regulator AlpA
MQSGPTRTCGARAKLLGSTASPPASADRPLPAGNFARPPPGHAAIDPLLDDRDLERLTGSKRSTWQKRRLSGDGPPFIRLGRLVRYRRSEVEAWLAAIPTLRSTSQADA